MSDIDARKRLILNNMENDPLTNAEKLEAVEELKEIYKAKKAAGENVPGRIQTIIANEMGLKKSQVANYEKILNHGSESVRESIRKDELPIDAAVALVDLPDKDQKKFLEENDSYSKKAVDTFKEELNKEHESCTERQLYYDENDEIQETELEKDEADSDTLEFDGDIVDEVSDISEQNENHFETIEEIMTAIINGMDKLSKKLNCVEFRDEYIQFQKVQIEIDKLMEQLGLVCEDM